MKVLVTGGAGFIGSHLTERLLRDGHRVRVLDNFATGDRGRFEALMAEHEVELVEGDMRSYERAHTAVEDQELVFHIAALPSVPRSIGDPLTSSEVNVGGTLNILLASRDADVRRVVFASSSSVYGANEELPKKETQHPLPIAPYGVAKLAAEGYCRSFTQVYGLETVALRYFNVFGPRQDPRSQYAAVVPAFISSLVRGIPPQISGDGEQSRDFTYVDNVVDATLLAAEAPGVGGRVYNIACQERTTVNELFREIRECLGSDVDPVYVGDRMGDIKHSLADISAAAADIGYRPEVSVSTGVRQTVADYLDRRAEDTVVAG
jgi:nucleoside-diphosphate-sugar epimerase